MMQYAELTLQNSPAEIVSYQIEQGRIILQSSGGEIVILPRDLHAVKFPKKNESAIFFGAIGEHQLHIKFVNIRGYLIQQMGQIPEKYSFAERIFGMGLWPFVLIGGSFVTIGLIIYFLLLPWLADRATEHFPMEQEIALGKELMGQYTTGEKVDTAGTRLLNEFGKTISFNTEYPLHFTLIESETVNAFAVPGGEIVVYTGILNILKSDEELAGLMAHEASHVIYKHSIRSMMRQLAGSMMIGLMVGDIGDISSTLIGQADQFRNLSYSRALETEADLKGMEILVRSKINPKGMVGLLNGLKSENPSGNNLPEFLLTHPAPDSRIEDLEKSMQNNNVKYEANSARIELFKRLKSGKPMF
jgi:Zn-dependent protease with chaperone function